MSFFDMEEVVRREPKTSIQLEDGFSGMFVYKAVWELLLAIQTFISFANAHPKNLDVRKVIAKFLEKLVFFHVVKNGA